MRRRIRTLQNEKERSNSPLMRMIYRSPSHRYFIKISPFSFVEHSVKYENLVALQEAVGASKDGWSRKRIIPLNGEHSLRTSFESK
ncbi:hypothetical protein TNIN_11111 [Trichonephila inaurata madagascariensis]|uniref:Uncharacterized protein n=1 Tax=Trichonephila inaurata madagascariensis TaxID=2747483 RepID=A0A8X6YNC9_9ARAC|nr:hypothetical protein TNIN_11111 [Trichonephila inaurata madagascariensis]